MTQNEIQQTCTALLDLANGKGTKDQMISARITIAMILGDDVATAMDKVLGAGTYDRTVSDVYHTLRGV